MNQETGEATTNWVVYIILCSDSSLYTGITNDLPRRFRQHFDRQGAKYFRARKPEKVVYVEDGHNRSTASKREFEIKRLKPAEKLLLVATEANNIDKGLRKLKWVVSEQF
jgi:putative endonuclease